MATVYRVHFASDREAGPWNEEHMPDGYGYWGAKYHGQELPPPPADNFDCLPDSPEGWYCGTKSPSLLRRWFDKNDREALKLAGFVCSVFETNDRRDGDHQSMFRMKDARVIGQLDLVTLKEIA